MRAGALLDGRHRLERPLGAGGMGVVWAARDERTGADVVVKLLPPEAATDVEAIARFVREAKLALRVEHPNVARTLELVTAVDGPPYIVQERLVGETLEDRLARGFVGAEEVARIGVALLDALAGVHALGILHRDVKPANVFLCAGASPPLVKLLDFGVARGGGEPALTRTGAVVGTPAYMAPEQFLDEELDPRVDVYAVGATLYECIAGRLPFASHGVRLVKDVIGAELPSLVGLRPDVDPALAAIVHRSLAKSRELRFASAAEMRAELAGWASLAAERVTAEPIAPSPPPRRARAPRAKARPSRVALGAAAVVVAAVTVSAVLGWATSTSRARRSVTLRARELSPPATEVSSAPPVPTPTPSSSAVASTSAPRRAASAESAARRPRRFRLQNGLMEFGGLGDDEAREGQSAFHAHVDAAWGFVECAPYDDRACNQVLVVVVHGDGSQVVTRKNCFPEAFTACVERTMRAKPFVPPALSTRDWTYGAVMAPP